jgi:hypothetical protein
MATEFSNNQKHHITLLTSTSVFALLFKEGPLTKNCLIDFAQSLAIYMKKSN